MKKNRHMPPWVRPQGVIWAVLAAVALPLTTVGQTGGYGGPSILSRGGNRPGQRGRAPVDFQFYGGLRGIVESGLTASAVDETGALQGVTASGFQAELSV